MPKHIQNQNGIALIIALVLMIMLTIIGLGIISTTNDEISIAGNEFNEMKAFYASEAGLDKATAEIQSHYEINNVPPVNLPAETLLIGGVSVGFSTTPEAVIQKTLTKGTMGGLKAYVTPHKIQSTAYDDNHNSAYILEQSFEVALIPLFQFGVFYETDLEIAPGPDMTLIGRVHSNSDIYIQAANSLTLESYMTAYGDIHHGRKAGSGLGESNGDVIIKSADGNYYSMKDGSDWLDSEDAYWFDSASYRWGGRVQDAAFGQENLNIPLQTPGADVHDIIERDDGGSNPDSYENKAGLKFIDGQAYYYNGSAWDNVTAPLTVAGAIQEVSFRDLREGKDVTVIDIDMSVLSSSVYAPDNGIVYVSDQRSGLHGARIHDAEELGMPLTIASENPVYTKGDINSVKKQPMAIITDALTILSDNWNDDPAFAANSDKTIRQASSTETNFCYITGNHNTGGGGYEYNGGLENLPRFLETWSGKTLKFRGSIVNLWLSEMATGEWSGNYYSPPDRDWAFDTDLEDPANMPPGTPMVRAFIRWGWKQIHVGYAASDFGAPVVEE